MQDPFPIPPIQAFNRVIQPYADKFNVPTLPLHIHEVLFSALLYTFVQVVVSPWISMRYAAKYYPKDSRAKKINWDSHVVSMFQSVLINILALWVEIFDKERNSMGWEERIWGYNGASGMVAAFAAGYFIWDFALTVCNLDVFGLGLLAHASSALVVYSFGFRPFLHYYGTTFILYELSTPFLNVHWFCDKLGMTGSRLQLYNGIALMGTFFGCRLVWGTFQSLHVHHDMWNAVWTGPSPELLARGKNGVMAFASGEPIPVWLALLYFISNVVLNSLNWFWFNKMIKAIRKRFEPAEGAAKEGKKADGQAAAVSATGHYHETVAERMEGLRKRAMSEISVPEIQGDLSEIQ